MDVKIGEAIAIVKIRQSFKLAIVWSYNDVGGQLKNEEIRLNDMNKPKSSKMHFFYKLAELPPAFSAYKPMTAEQKKQRFEIAARLSSDKFMAEASLMTAKRKRLRRAQVSPRTDIDKKCPNPNCPYRSRCRLPDKVRDDRKITDQIVNLARLL